ncbi:MAG: peptidyl-prolyl cis-trans isomerase [Desulfobacterales bacterium]|nr:peptidyl-prolyl cis-trans isomerase [Desulfobacterales bacterium]
MEKIFSHFRRLWAAPLCRFFAGGILIFAVYWLSDTREQHQAYYIQVGQGQVERLKSAWIKEKKRTITGEELRSLVQAEVEEEMLSREARRLGLGRNDRVIKRRLVQKYRFMLDDAVIVPEPDEITLKDYYAAHLNQYLVPERLSFDHLFFSNAGRMDPYGDAAAARMRSKGGSSGAISAGDAFPGPVRIEARDKSAVNGIFGEPFFDRLRTLTSGEWSPPVASAYGWHLVYLRRRTASGSLSFEAAKPRVLNDWRREKRQGAAREQLEKLRGKYVVETPSYLSGKAEIAGRGN